MQSGKLRKSVYPVVRSLIGYLLPIKSIGAVHTFPDWEIMILLPLLQQLDRQM